MPTHIRGSRQPGRARARGGERTTGPERSSPAHHDSETRITSPGLSTAARCLPGILRPDWQHGGMADDTVGTPRFLTLADVAEVLNTSSAQVYALVRRGDLPAIKIGGRGQWRVESSPLEDFIQRMYAETKHLRRRAPARGGRASRGLSRSADLRVERDLDRALLVPADHRELQRLAGLVGADHHDQRDAVGDPVAVQGRSRRRPSPARPARPGCPAGPPRSPRPGRRRGRRCCTVAPMIG